MSAPPRVVAFGEGAALVELDVGGAAPADRAARTLGLADAMRAAFPGADVVVGGGTVLVAGARIDEVATIAERAGDRASRDAAATHVIEAAYDGPDLDEVAAALGIAAAEVIARHTGSEYVAELVGFLPGFAYLSPLGPWGLTIPRRASPRPKVPAGSIGVAGGFTGIYPFASPGGWNLIARAIDAVPFDPALDPPALIRPGDRVRFAPVDAASALAKGSLAKEGREAPRAGATDARKALRVIAAPACATIQDRGRGGQLGRGLPPSGPLDVETFEAANAAAGNPRGAAAIEVPLGSLEVEAKAGAVVSIDGAPAIALAGGERLRVAAAERAVRYLAVRGGCDVPEVLGARATLLVARLGGLDGRALKRGDVIAIGDASGDDGAREAAIDREEGEWIDVDPGPHLARFPADAMDALLAAEWRVSRLGDRVGVRLEGGRVPREGPDPALPVPMMRGAIEVATDGTPIVLGPDHPTTGGYPVIAVVRARGQAALARRPPGGAVRFRLGRGSRGGGV